MNPFGVNEDSNGNPVPAKAPENPFSDSNPASPNPFDAPASVSPPPAAPLQESVAQPAPPAAPDPVPTPTLAAPVSPEAPVEEPRAAETPQPVSPTPPIPPAETAAPTPPAAPPVIETPPTSAAPPPAEAAPTAPVNPLVPVAEPPPPSLGDSPAPAPAPAAESAEPADEPRYPIAWQPFTFSGIASFAHASVNRLLLVELLMALIVGATVLWFVDRDYEPVLVGAMKKMPEESVIRRGILFGVPSQLLAENKFLSIAVEWQEADGVGQSADLQLELHRQDFRLCSLFRSETGVLQLPYPPVARIPMSDAALEPWWGAWHPIFYVGIVVGAVLFLMISWTFLATIYVVIPRLIAYYADRAVRTNQAWNVAGAALMPGALVMELGIVLYGFGVLDLIGLGMFTGVHVVVGWIYVIAAPFFLPRQEDCPPQTNPFKK